MLKRLLALFVTVGMISGLTSIPVRAEVIVNEACTGGGTFQIEDNVVYGNQNNCIGSVVIPEGVTLVDEYAFSETTGITSVTIPASVTEIYYGFFADSDMVTINVAPGNANYKSIDGVLFNKSGTTLLAYPSAKAGDYTAPLGVATIGEEAFAYASEITSITLSATVANISGGAFRNSTLSAITVVVDNTTFKSIDGVLFSKNGATLMLYPAKKAGAYTLPVDVTAIGSSAFQDAVSLTGIVLPANVTTIREYAFAYSTSLASVTFEPGSKLTSIGQDAFRETALTTIEIPASVTTIGRAAFTGISVLTTFTFELGSNLTSIGDDAFCNTALTTIEIPANVTSIGDSAFSRLNSLTSVSFEAGSMLTSIGAGSFDGTGITSVTIPASVTSIGDGAFDSGSLATLTFEAGSKLISIGNSAFRFTTLAEVIIPASVTSIGDEAFRQTSLTSVTFEASSKLTSIGDQAFQQSDKLESITIPASVTKIGNFVFTNSVLLDTVSFEAGSQLVTIGQGAFGGLVKLVTVSIPASVTTIEGYAFEGASSLVTVTFEPGSKLTTIKNHVFRQTSISEITIPAGVTSIGPWAFSFASDLTSITFLGNAPTVGDNAFYRTPTSLTAYASNCATGFTADGSGKWYGLVLSVVPASNPCIVVYNLNGGTGIASGPLNLEGKVDAAPTTPTRTGYAFSGWSATNGGDLVTFPYGSDGSANLTLYAKWTVLNVVNYESNGGTSVANSYFANGGSIEVAPSQLTRSGYTFAGWSATNGGSAITFPYTPGATNNITLYANWTVLNVVNYESNGGRSVANSYFANGGSIEVAPSQPIRSGYTFAGWSATNGGSAITFPYAPGVTNNITLYAMWTVITVVETPVSAAPTTPSASNNVAGTPAVTSSVAATKTSYAPAFPAGSGSLTNASKSALKKIVKTSGTEAIYTVTGAASKSFGVPSRFVKALAKSRAAKIKAYLIKLGVKESSIIIKTKITGPRMAPKTKIKVG